jgi:hypothetical protein
MVGPARYPSIPPFGTTALAARPIDAGLPR